MCIRDRIEGVVRFGRTSGPRSLDGASREGWQDLMGDPGKGPSELRSPILDRQRRTLARHEGLESEKGRKLRLRDHGVAALETAPERGRASSSRVREWAREEVAASCKP